MTWQPIATAPDDGTVGVLFCRDGSYAFAFWRKDARYAAGGVWQDADREMLVHPDATHWAELHPPADPQARPTKEQP